MQLPADVSRGIQPNLRLIQLRVCVYTHLPTSRALRENKRVLELFFFLTETVPNFVRHVQVCTDKCTGILSIIFIHSKVNWGAGDGGGGP